MTPIERFREAVGCPDWMDMNIGTVAREVGPLLLALVDAVEEYEKRNVGFPNDYIDSHSRALIKSALAKLKEDE